MREEVIDGIYEAAVVPELWPDVLDRISVVGQCFGGVLFAVTPAREPQSGFPIFMSRWVASDAFHEAFGGFVRDGWAEKNLRARRALASDHAGFITDLDMCSAAEIETDPFYKYVRGVGFGWCTGTTIKVPSGDTMILSWERRTADGPVDRNTVARLDPLRPHLARAALMASRLGLERAKAATKALAIVGLPAAVISPRQRILAANDLFQSNMPALVEERSFGRVRFMNDRADKLLAQALGSILAGQIAEAKPAQVLSIPIASADETPATVAHVIPLRRTAREIFSTASAVLVLTPAVAMPAPAHSVVQGLFDLTAAEARVARAIVGGRTIEEIARAASVSSGTVRNQLKSVFSKVGVSRQAELVGLLGGTALRTPPQ